MKEIEIGTIKTTEKLGFSFVPDQFRRKSIENGFNFNLMIIGRRGLGTTTLINSLFTGKIINDREDSIKSHKYEIYENEILLKLNVTTCHNLNEEIIEFINSQYLDFYQKEIGLTREFDDNRVHLVIFLIPTDNITENELEIMRKVGEITNLLPIISKADTFTPEELIKYKNHIKILLKEHHITYYVPQDNEIDSEILSDTRDIIQNYPLAVISSEEIYEINGEHVRGRKYPWGFVNVETQSDFLSLRKLIIYSHFENIKFTADVEFYNKFRNLHETPGISKEYIKRIMKEMEVIIKERNLQEELNQMSNLSMSDVHDKKMLSQ